MEKRNKMKATENLRVREKRFRLMFEKTMNGIALHEIVLDQKGKPADYVFLEVNSAFERLTGLKRKDLIGKKVTEISPEIEKDPADWIGRYGKVALTGQEVSFEQYSVPLAKWYAVRAYSPQKGQFVTILEDITMHKRTEEEVAKARKLIDKSLSSAPDGVFLIDKQGIFTYVNPAFLKMISYEEKDVVGKTIQEIIPKIVPPVSAKIIQEKAKKRLETGESIIGAEFELLNKKGETTPVSYSASGIKDGRGNIIGEVVFLRDITEPKRVEEALRKSGEKYKNLFENAEAGMYRSKLDGSGVLAVNKKLTEILGLPKEEILSNSVFMYWKNPEDRKEMVKQLLHKGFVSDYEISLIHKNGAVKTCLMSGKVYQKEGLFEGSLVDITARKQSEEVLRESEMKYRTLYESSLDGIIFTDVDGNIMDANDSLCNMLGFTKAEIRQQSYQALTPPEWAESDKAQVEQLIVQGYIKSHEKEYFRKDGTRVPIEISAWLIKNETGKSIGMWGIVRDITERKRIESILQENEARFRSVVESPMIGILFWDANGDITDANKTFLQMVEYTKDEVLSGKIRWRDMTPPEFKEQDDKALQEIAATGVMTPIEKEYISKDGSRIPILLGAASLAGPVLHGVAFVLDISERKQLEEELFLKDLAFEASIAANSTADINGNINHCNPAFLKIWGYDKKEEVLGKPIADFFMNKEETEPVLQSLNTTGQWQGEFLAKKKDGSTFISRGYSAVIRTKKGKMIGYQSANLDVTAQIQAEEKLNITLKNLERSNKELEQFAYVASHDLQEPLRMISSYTQLLEQRYKDQLDEDAKDFINFAVDGAYRMQILINDLLSYSRTSTTGKPFSPTDCHAVLGQVLANLGRYIQENHALITNDDLPIVMADEAQLVQLFQNLITNAVKFRGKKPPRIHVSVDEKDNEWTFSVCDNSIGIEPEYKDKIFVIFQRLHNKDQYPGTGIGLATCKKIVERHGGKIWFTSVPGQGSTFYFTIPKIGRIL